VKLPVVVVGPTKRLGLFTDAPEGSTKVPKEDFAVTSKEFKDASTKKLERVKRKSQFIQTFQAGSNSQHFNCGPVGCGDIKGNTQIIGGQVDMSLH